MTAIKKPRSHEIDMTRGALLPKILLFTLPVIGTSLLQLLFNTVDMIVVGRFEGDAALGAVGTTSSLVNLINSLFIGLSTGSGACVSVAIGARHDRDTSDLVHTAMTTALISGGILALVGYFGAPFFLSLMNIDDSLIGMSITYLRIYFLGAPFIMLYNFGFSIMRTLGDTRRPLFYMMYAGIANVGFNLFFVLVCGLGVAGVAIGTVISFAISSVLIVSALHRYDNACRLSLRRLGIRPSCLFDIMRIGIPAGFRGMLFGISNTLLQASVNSLGPEATSANAAAAQLESLLYVIVAGFAQTTTYFVGQNYGAGRFRRLRRALFICIGLSAAAGVVFGTFFILLRVPLIALYLPDSPEIAALAYERMFAAMFLYFLEGTMEALSGALQGIKVSLTPMLLMLGGVCGLRLFWIFVIFPLPAFHSLFGLFLCYPLSWGVTDIILGALAFFFFRKKAPLSADREAIA
jgi:putative MATE family efflux protein